MADLKQREAVSELVDRHRRDLSERTDISQAMRRLSQSSGRNPMGSLQRKPRSMGMTLLIAVPAMLAMVLCVGTAGMTLVGNLWLQNQLNDPTTTVQKYYAAVRLQKYGEAYSYFTDHYKASLAEASYASKWSLYDTVDGLVASNVVTHSTVGDTTATVTVTVVRRVPDTAQVQTLDLVKVGNNWLIDNIQVSDNAPVPTVAS